MKSSDNRNKSTLISDDDSCRMFRNACKQKGLNSAFYDRLVTYPVMQVENLLKLIERSRGIIDESSLKEISSSTVDETKAKIEILLELFPNDIRAEEWKQAKKIIDDYFSKQ